MKHNTFTVLTVDDARLIRRNVANLLGELDVSRVLEAGNGREAIAILRQHRVDLIISDWTMPEMNGQELLEWVRANEDTQKTPFIMLTAEGDQERVIAALKAGVTNYIIKPFTSETLYKKIRQFLPKTPKPAPHAQMADD